jgi:hypothetical protein
MRRRRRGSEEVERRRLRRSKGGGKVQAERRWEAERRGGRGVERREPK